MDTQAGSSFSSTGPQGHRGRMRTRLLTNEAALADYEILEMLLFLGIPRRDTKPLAKALINRFGSLAETLAAPAPALQGAGLPARAGEALALVTEAQAQLARPDAKVQPVLDGWAALIRHIDPAGRAAGPGWAGLLLDSRNRLLAEPRWPGEAGADLPRMLLRAALERHASAVILLCDRPGLAPHVREADRAVHDAVVAAATPLSVVVHELVVVGEGRWCSLRQGAG